MRRDKRDKGDAGVCSQGGAPKDAGYIHVQVGESGRTVRCAPCYIFCDFF